MSTKTGATNTTAGSTGATTNDDQKLDECRSRLESILREEHETGVPVTTTDMETLIKMDATFRSAQDWKSLIEVRRIISETEKAAMAAELAETKTEKAAMAAELDETKTTLAETKTILAENKPALLMTIPNTYLTKDGKATLPFMQINSSVTPSFKGHARQGQSIKPAKLILSTFGAKHKRASDCIRIPIKSIDGTETTIIKSSIGPHSEVSPLEYVNEIEVQVQAQNLVRDAIACLGLERLLKTHLEISFYGCTPDIVVVTIGKRPIFAIEIKSPERDGKAGEVMEGKYVGGQLWLYLMAMKQMGIQQPLGAIMTFNKLRVASTDNFEKLKDYIEGATDALQTDVTTVQHPKTDQGDIKPPYSPTKETMQFSTLNQRYKGKFTPDDFKPDTRLDGVLIFKHRLYVGTVQEDGDVFCSLLLALKVAFDSAKLSPLQQPAFGEPNEIAVVHHGDDLGYRVLPIFTKKSIIFGFTQKDLTANCQVRPDPKSSFFFSLASLGHGSRGEVYLVCNSSGRVASCKLYTIKRSQLSTPEEREDADKVSIEKIKNDRDAEKERWDLLFPEKARSIDVAGRPALLMPYGIPLVSPADRAEWLPKVGKELERYAAAGFAYTESDLRWRHVLLLQGEGEPKVLLADLGSLQPVEEGADRNAIVQEQMKQLERRLDPIAHCATSAGKRLGGSPDGNDNKKRQAVNGQE